MTNFILFSCFSCVFALVFSTQSYNIDLSQGLGRQFDGIGGISGGGATSKLLINYNESYRSEVLDYLFKPNFGASLQILKVEIGGDGPSPDGSESSHMHESWDERYDRGYEWWLMVEAKKRNPSIKLYGLPWSFPGWVAMGTQNPWTNVTMTAHYIMKWIQGAKLYYNLDINYIGIWNEKRYDVRYVKVLRDVLDRNGFRSVMIVVTDNVGWAVSEDILSNPILAQDVTVIGSHYPHTNSSTLAMKTGKALWASEDYSTYNNDIGAECWARALNQNYVNGYMTSTISWDLIASYYEDLPYGRDGLMTALEPWSGHYVVESPIWVTAHTTHFTSVGWRYLKHGSGVGHLAKGGSYVSLTDRDTGDFTMVIETMTHNHSKCIRRVEPEYVVKRQNVTFKLHGQLAKLSKLYVWRTRFYYNGQTDEIFHQLDPIQVVNDSVTLLVDIDSIYTLTTLVRDRPTLYPESPKSKPFSLPYRDTFEGYALHSEAYYFVPLTGVWEIRPGVKGHGQVNRQVVLHEPCYWCIPGLYPVNIGGNYQWRDIYIKMDVYIPAVNGTSGVFMATRVTTRACGTVGGAAIVFTIYANNNNFSVSTGFQLSDVIFTGRLSNHVGYDAWYHIGLAVTGSRAVGFFDKDQVFSISIPDQPIHGFAGYGATSYGIADYDNLNIDDYTPRTNSKTMFFDRFNGSD